MIRATLLVLALCTLGGCTVGPDYTRPDLASVVPDEFGEAPTVAASVPLTRDISAWWRELGDDELTRCVELSLTSSLDLQEALERVVTARARRGIENAARLPTVDGELLYGRAQTGEEGLNFQGPPPGVETDVYSLGAVAGWEADLWGRVARLVEAADAEIRFAIEDYRAIRVALAAETAREVILIRGLDLERDAIEATIETDRDRVDIAIARARAGFADELDVARARRVLERNESVVPELLGRRREAELRIATLLGATPDGVTIEYAGLPRRDVVPSLGAPADLLLRRPDVRRAEATLRAANARIGAAEADFYPRVTLSGTLALAGSDSGDLFNGDAFVFNAGPKVTVPLFEGGRLRARLNAVESEQRRAIIAFRRALVHAVAEVETAAVRLRRTEEQAAELSEAEAAAIDTASIASDRFEAGIVDYLDVTEARRELLSIRRARVIAERDALFRLVDLYAALGGGWDVPPRDGSPHRVAQRSGAGE